MWLIKSQDRSYERFGGPKILTHQHGTTFLATVLPCRFDTVPPWALLKLRWVQCTEAVLTEAMLTEAVLT